MAEKIKWLAADTGTFASGTRALASGTWTFASDTWTMFSGAAADTALAISQDRRRTAAVTLYLVGAFATGNMLSEMWNLYLRSMI